MGSARRISKPLHDSLADVSTKSYCELSASQVPLDPAGQLCLCGYDLGSVLTTACGYGRFLAYSHFSVTALLMIGPDEWDPDDMRVCCECSEVTLEGGSFDPHSRLLPWSWLRDGGQVVPARSVFSFDAMALSGRRYISNETNTRYCPGQGSGSFGS